MAAAERDSLLAWVLASLPPGSLATPEGAAADIDVARLDVDQLLVQLRGATIQGVRVDLTHPRTLRAASPPPAVLSESVGGSKKRGERAKRLARYESILLCAFLGSELRGDAADRRLDQLQRAFGVEDGVQGTSLAPRG